MIDFTSTQLSWILIGACSIGGTGYITMDNKIVEMDKKLSVAYNTIENSNRIIAQMENQLLRIEEKLDRQTRNK